MELFPMVSLTKTIQDIFFFGFPHVLLCVCALFDFYTLKTGITRRLSVHLDCDFYELCHLPN